MVWSIFESDGRQVGYGQWRCYLDSTLLVELTMIGPLALVTICNVTFFGVTVYKIQEVRGLQVSQLGRRDDVTNLYVYVKLSSMTGAFWLLAILAEASDNSVLRYVSILLNGCQGVLIFVSYICNTRVLRLYLPHHVTRSSSDSPWTHETSLRY
ncbi:uncharacterized protein LOC131954184 [Physella acuta]|uniref:uncharacterized protein LOC131954184 n=1 Tax=Physella acuta TaxID=109671 RepID=UPI0027DD23C6|nr:uncharacterized protein LOC131954184 [Physella acuta]